MRRPGNRPQGGDGVGGACGARRGRILISINTDHAACTLLCAVFLAIVVFLSLFFTFQETRM